jgi:hypothetical protein
MLYACVERFDVMGGRGNIFRLGWEVNKALRKFFFLSTRLGAFIPADRVFLRSVSK